jgi:hypothetical protein
MIQSLQQQTGKGKSHPLNFYDLRFLHPSSEEKHYLQKERGRKVTKPHQEGTKGLHSRTWLQPV